MVFIGLVMERDGNGVEGRSYLGGSPDVEMKLASEERARVPTSNVTHSTAP